MSLKILWICALGSLALAPTLVWAQPQNAAVVAVPSVPATASRDLSAYKEETLPGGVLAGAAYVLFVALIGGYAYMVARKLRTIEAHVAELAEPSAATPSTEAQS
ncbi:MAG: hypothetical protein EXR77_03720 [Myxococcales bacterium]|nr:hypothetical protein [Myxococcales bacterium]